MVLSVWWRATLQSAQLLNLVRYVFISSAAVYEPTSQPGIDETAAVQTDVPTPNEVEWWHTELLAGYYAESGGVSHA